MDCKKCDGSPEDAMMKGCGLHWSIYKYRQGFAYDLYTLVVKQLNEELHLLEDAEWVQPSDPIAWGLYASLRVQSRAKTIVKEATGVDVRTSAEKLLEHIDQPSGTSH